MSTTYVLGFLFDPRLLSVVLIEKRKPEWQAGRLNGVGGKVEEGETPGAAMVREFQEETGVLVPEWQQYATVTGADGRHFALHVFFAVNTLIRDVWTVTEEKVVLATTAEIVRGEAYTIGNLPWLVAMAMAVATGKENCKMFHIQERS